MQGKSCESCPGMKCSLLQALADRTSVACTLTRGNYNRVWNEVLVGETDQAVCMLVQQIISTYTVVKHERMSFVSADAYDII